MKYVFYILSILVFISLIISCEEDDPDPCTNLEEAYIIGYDPCGGFYPDTTNWEYMKAGGYIVALTERDDTVATYNLPDTLYNFPIEYFDDRQYNCYFPRSQWDTYKINVTYKFASEDEKIVSGCTTDIATADFSIITNNKQIIIQCVTR